MMTKLNRLSSILRAAIKSQPKPKPQLRSFTSSNTPKPQPQTLTSSNQQTFSQLPYNFNSIKNAPPDSFDEASLRSTDDIFYAVPSLDKINDTVNAFTASHSIQWVSIVPPEVTLIPRLEKQKWTENSSGNCFGQLLNIYGQKVGKAAVDIFRELERQSAVDVEDYNEFIRVLLEHVEHSDNKGFVVEQLSVVYKLLQFMTEKSILLDEENLALLFEYFLNMGMEEELHSFSHVIKQNNDAALPRLGYYELSLYINLHKEDKIRELCHYILTNDSDENAELRENYLVALCDGDRKNDLLHLLEVIDVTKVSSVKNLTRIFASFGRLSLESYAKRFLLELKDHDYGADTISELIYHYASSIPNFRMEDVVSEFKYLHVFLKMVPHLQSYERLVFHSTVVNKPYLALDVVRQICEEGLTISEDRLDSLLEFIESTCQFHLVHRIHSLIYDKVLKPTCSTFKRLISCRVKMKEFDRAYAMLDDMKKFNLVPTACMYNVIMEGYFQEKNPCAVRKVFNQMKLAGVQPDSQTYFYVNKCNSEDNISEYNEDRLE